MDSLTYLKKYFDGNDMTMHLLCDNPNLLTKAQTDALMMAINRFINAQNFSPEYAAKEQVTWQTMLQAWAEIGKLDDYSEHELRLHRTFQLTHELIPGTVIDIPQQDSRLITRIAGEASMRATGDIRKIIVTDGTGTDGSRLKVSTEKRGVTDIRDLNSDAFHATYLTVAPALGLSTIVPSQLQAVTLTGQQMQEWCKDGRLNGFTVFDRPNTANGAKVMWTSDQPERQARRQRFLDAVGRMYNKSQFLIRDTEKGFMVFAILDNKVLSSPLNRIQTTLWKTMHYPERAIDFAEKNLSNAILNNTQHQKTPSRRMTNAL